MLRLAFAAAFVLLLPLAGCSSGGESDGADLDSFPDPETTTTSAPSATAAPADAPACASVWVPGQTLPAGYTTCLADGGSAPQDVMDCLDDTSLIVFDDRLYAVTGQEIVEPADAPLQDTDEFGSVYVACTGE